MSLFERPILIFSKYCKYSMQFLENLSTIPNLFDAFVRVNIDADPITKKRPQVFDVIQHALQLRITEVPTLILDQGKTILTGKNAFMWLDNVVSDIEEQLQQNQQNQSQQESPPQNNLQSNYKPEDISCFNPNEMGGFSDCYATINSEQPSQHTFQFINQAPIKIVTPEDFNEKLSQTDMSRLQQERDTVKSTSVNSNNFLPRPEMIRVENYPVNNKSNPKQNEMDQRLSQLMKERDSALPKRPDTNPVQVNFTTGQVLRN